MDFDLISQTLLVFYSYSAFEGRSLYQYFDVQSCIMKVTMKVNNYLKTMVISSPNQFWFLSFVYVGWWLCLLLFLNL